MSGQAAFEFFKNEYNEDDVLVRTEAVAKLPIVASLMGPEKVRNELLPFLVGKFYFTFSSSIFIIYFEPIYPFFFQK